MFPSWFLDVDSVLRREANDVVGDTIFTIVAGGEAEEILM